MSGPFGSSQWMYNSGGSFYPTQINDSLRFEDGSSAYLNRTPSSSGNRRTFTLSVWVKRGNIVASTILSARPTNGNPATTFGFFNNDGNLNFQTNSSELTTSAKYRDPSAWYHIVLAVDTTQATSSNRVKLYLNGEQVTAFTTQSYPAQNAETEINNSARNHMIGRNPNYRYFDGYMADVYMIDGQALDPTSFGETKDGVWIPKSYSGSYGTNGFHLEFNGNSNDTSGNSNNWTANNISAHDYVSDSPTNNFATMNSIAKKSTVTLSEGNLKSFSNDPSIVANVEATFGISSGKWYFEASSRSGSNVGYPVIYLADASTRSFNNTNYTGNGCSAYGAPIVNGSLLTRVASLSLSSTDVRQFAFDFDNGKMWIGKNGTWYNNSGTSFTNSTGPESGNNFNSNSGFTYDIGKLFSGHNDGNCAITFNFGQDSTFSGATTAGGNQDDNGIGDFKYAPPSGFLALCTANLPEPTIVDGSEHFNTVLYTGNGSSRSITGVGFQPDWVWGKARNHGYSHWLYDSVRGAEKLLRSDLTNAEANQGQGLTAFNADGFSLGTTDDHNENTKTFASWNWKAGGTAVSNTNGSITSQVSANTDAGFSIVSWDGAGASAGATVGHGLNSAPELILPKNRGAIGSWHSYHSALGGTKGILLNSTNAVATDSGFWNNTDPTSSVFTVGTYNVFNNDYIAYCFHSVEGFSKVGSYTGNGSSDGTFVYTGFRPAYVLGKNTTLSGPEWFIFDTNRDPYNTMDSYLYASSSGAEQSGSGRIDLLSNGFKLRDSANAWNGSHTYIYLAFAENPFKYANAR